MYYLERYKISSGQDTIIIVEKNIKKYRKMGEWNSVLIEILKGDDTKKGYKAGDEIFFEKNDVIDQDMNLKKLKQRLYLNLL